MGGVYRGFNGAAMELRSVVLRPALFLPLCIDLFEVGQAQKTHDYEGGNLA